jgi:hypothetical protein
MMEDDQAMIGRQLWIHDFKDLHIFKGTRNVETSRKKYTNGT